MKTVMEPDNVPCPHPDPWFLPKEKRPFPNRMWFRAKPWQLSCNWQKWLVGCSFVLYLGLTGCMASSSATSPSASVVDGLALESNAPENATGLLPGEEELLAQVVQGQMLPVTAQVELRGQTIGLEVAETRQQQAIGLMHRERLLDDQGMLFPFSPARPVNFWMKNVLIPLDMVFVYQGEVVAIASDVPPCKADPCQTYGPARQVVDYVIELRGGLAENLGLSIGDPIEIQWLETSSEPSP